MKMTSAVLVLLALLTITEAMSLRGLGIELRCRCIQTESREEIRRHIKKVEIVPAHSHCEDTEIIATLRGTDAQVCLHPEAQWVKNFIKRMMSRALKENIHTEWVTDLLSMDEQRQKKY